MGLLRTLQPEWWFSAHLHTRFEAVVVHSGGDDMPAGSSAPPSSVVQNPDEITIDDDEFEGQTSTEVVHAESMPVAADVVKLHNISRNEDEITLDDEEEDVAPPPLPPPPTRETKFLALDKCLPRREFLEVSTDIHRK